MLALAIAWPVIVSSRGASVGNGRAHRSVGPALCTADYHNCWASRHCCNPNSRCYTKADGVRFAQCRPNGCIGTCAWECRVLSSAKTAANVEYGDGAQNLSEAIAAMKQPLPLPTNSTTQPTGRSERLGNIIDSWYFGSLGGGPPLAHLLSLSCGMSTCFARFLATQLGQVSASTLQTQAAFREASKHKSWGLYSYPTIQLLMPQVRHDLRAAIHQYSQQYDTSLARQSYDGGRRHLIVHYRLGDFVTNSWCIPPRDVAAAAAELDPTVIEILDGGTHHLDQVDGYSASPHRPNRTRQAQALRMSADLQGELEVALRAAAPKAKVTRPSRSSSIDADWFRCVHAPLLVTAAGSFAVTAAIAGYGRQIRTPASDNLNFPDRTVRDAQQIAPNWMTYMYDARAMRG